MAELDGSKLIPEVVKLQFAFELDQLVFLMVNNRVYCSKVTSRTIIDNVDDEVSIIKPNTQPFGRGGVFYSVNGEEYEQHLLFASRDELLESL